MKTGKFIIIYSIISLFLLLNASGCFFFKKSVMKDTADNVEEALIIDANGEKILVTKEEIFQATSKSQKGGFRQTSGYREYRLTSYDINTGKILKRIDLGESDDNFHYLLGPSEGLLWYMSIDKETGLHARDPKTLEIKISQEEIIKVNPDLKDNLPAPIWYELRKYYGFDYGKKMPMISDNSGFIYYLNPKTLKVDKTGKSIEYFHFEETTTSTSMNLDKDNYLSLTGSPRKHLSIKSKEYEEPSYLDGQFLFSSNKSGISDANPKFSLPIIEKRENKQRALDSLSQILEEAKDDTKMKSWELSHLKDMIKYAERDLKDLDKEIEKLSDEKSNTIITNDGCIFIIHQSNATDTSKVMISKVKINNDNTIEEKWQTYIPDVFSEPSKVMDKPGFEYVFSKGSPDFSKKRVIFSDNKLILILMLRAVCLDADSGNILWNIEL